MTPRVFYWSLTSALAGFLFGFDTVVISGAEKTLQNLWQLSDALHGLAMSSALWGTVLGSLVGGWPADRFGRKLTLVGVGVLYFVSAVGCGLAPDMVTFVLARFVGGVGIGVSTVAAPLYIAEIAPPHRRGLLTCLFQFNIIFGILVAYLSNALLAGLGPDAWRWMLGVVAAPAAAYTAMVLTIPESPRWLLRDGGDPAEGLRVLALANADLPPAAVAELAAGIRAAAAGGAAGGGFWTRRLRRPIQLAVLIAFFNQLSGINAVLYFAPRIFELAGLGEKAALLQSVGIGVVNLAFTFLGLWLIDRVGRRTLLLVGSVGYIASLGLCSWAFATETYAIVPACIFGFIAAHGMGQGAVIWVYISEIFPDRHRATGQSLGSFTHWVFAALLTTVFPSMVAAFPTGLVFLFFCLMMVLQLVWVITAVPETKGVPLEEIEARLGVS